MSEDVIIKDSKKQFRLRIDGFLRSIGVFQIIGTTDYLEIEFMGGECCIRVLYPRKLEELHEAIKKELLAETQLSLVEIDNIRFYIHEHIEGIEKARKYLTQ